MIECHLFKLALMGIAGVSFEAIESAEGVEAFTLEFAQALKERSYQTSAVRRVMIPKSDGSQRR